MKIIGISEGWQGAVEQLRLNSECSEHGHLPKAVVEALTTEGFFDKAWLWVDGGYSSKNTGTEYDIFLVAVFKESSKACDELFRRWCSEAELEDLPKLLLKELTQTARSHIGACEEAVREAKAELAKARESARELAKQCAPLRIAQSEHAGLLPQLTFCEAEWDYHRGGAMVSYCVGGEHSMQYLMVRADGEVSVGLLTEG